MSNLSRKNCSHYAWFVVAALFALMFCLLAAPSTAYGKPKKAKYGTIKILTTPGGLPLSVDGKAYGETTTEYRALDLEPGLHVIDITLPSGQRWTREIDLPPGRIKCIALNYRPGQQLPKSPCPYPVILSAPSQVSEGEIVTYTSDVTYGGTANLHYTWTISPANARLISGTGTPTITVDSTGLAGQRITAVLVVDDGSGDTVCRKTAQASTLVPPPVKRAIEGREFDTCSSCSYDDQKARLDNLAVELQNDPTTTTYIFAYGGRTSPLGQADRLLARARDYLVSQRGIDASRIILSNGGFREQDAVEVWLVPRGATPPRPSPTIQSGDAKPSPAPSNAPTRRRRS
jgi:hypothetical protein